MRPILHPVGMAVFQWIHVHIIHMPPRQRCERDACRVPDARGAQKIDFAHQQIIAVAFEQVDRKEPGAVGYEGATVLSFLGRAAPLARHVRVPYRKPGGS